MPDKIAMEEYLSRYPQEVRDQIAILRALVRSAAPEAAERVILGWGIIAYDHFGIFCYIDPGPRGNRLRLGFNWGASLPDPHRLLGGTAQFARHIPVAAELPVELALTDLVQAAFVHQLMRREAKPGRNPRP